MTKIHTPNYLRGQDFFNPEDHPSATVWYVGVGGIGSFAALAGAKLGVPRIRVIDPDFVEPHNLPNQLYDTDHIGESKVAAAHNMIEAHTECDVRQYMAKVTDEGWVGVDVPDFNGVVVSGLDSMQARTDLWLKAVKMNLNVPLYLDARLGGEAIVIYAPKPWDKDDITQYEKTLHSDDEAEDLPCTRRAVIDVGFQVAAILTRYLRMYYARQDIPKVSYFSQDTLTMVARGDWLRVD